MNEHKEHLPVCRRLRFKGMFVQVEPDPLVPNPHDGFCWCSRTHNALGPDGRPVLREECLPGRDCFERL